MYRLTKSMLMSLHQCPLRFWRERHEPALAKVSSVAAYNAALGLEVGRVARDVLGQGVLIGHESAPLDAVRETRERLGESGPLCLFEAAFLHAGVLVRVDVLVRDESGRYQLFEVKSSSKVKAHHVLDAAIQAWVVRQAGLPVERVQVVHVDSGWVAGEPGDYVGLLVPVDVTHDVDEFAPTVAALVERASALLDGERPTTVPGRHCEKPHPCSFESACRADEPEFPISVLPRLSGAEADALLAAGIRAISDIPPGMVLRPAHRRWAECIRSNTTWLDANAIRAELARLLWPRYYLDFETVGFAAPRWRGARPREQHIFQWSMLIEHAPGEIERRAFLAQDDRCPVEEAVRSLIAAAGRKGPVIHYANAERINLRAAKRLVPSVVAPLIPLEARMYDLLARVVHGRVVIPAMRGSEGLKAVHPALTGRNAYEELRGVHDGTGASAAYLRMIDPARPSAERERLRNELLAYCALDVDAMRDIVTELCRRVGLDQTEPA